MRISPRGVLPILTRSDFIITSWEAVCICVAINIRGAPREGDPTSSSSPTLDLLSAVGTETVEATNGNPLLSMVEAFGSKGESWREGDV